MKINPEVKNTRGDPETIKAAAIGAVACENCGGVHIDFLDENDRIVATGFLTFDSFRVMTTLVGAEMAEIKQ